MNVLYKTEAPLSSIKQIKKIEEKAFDTVK